MDRAKLKEWVTTAVVWLVLAGIVWGLWHYSVVLPRRAKAERAAEVAEWIALRRKVNGDFDDYLRAAPLLKGDTAIAFKTVVIDRISEMGLEPDDNRIQGSTPAQRWRSAHAIVAARTAKASADKLLIEDETRRCSTVLPPDRCRDMVELWHCTGGDFCTEYGAGIAGDIAWDWREDD